MDYILKEQFRFGTAPGYGVITLLVTAPVKTKFKSSIVEKLTNFYPDVLPGFELGNSGIKFQKDDLFKVELADNEPQQILDQLVEACKKVERGEFFRPK